MAGAGATVGSTCVSSVTGAGFTLGMSEVVEAVASLTTCVSSVTGAGVNAGFCLVEVSGKEPESAVLPGG